MEFTSTATLVIIRNGEDVLLGVKQNGPIGTGKLNAPGGRLEEGESLLDCASREVMEEVGVKVDADALQHLGTLEHYAGDEPFQRVYVYYAEEYSGTPCETESMIPEWVPIDDLPFERMHEGDRHWFSRAAHGERFLTCTLWYERRGEGYLRHEFAA